MVSSAGGADNLSEIFSAKQNFFRHCPATASETESAAAGSLGAHANGVKGPNPGECSIICTISQNVPPANLRETARAPTAVRACELP